jgi:hypothetical protein
MKREIKFYEFCPELLVCMGVIQALITVVSRTTCYILEKYSSALKAINVLNR